MIKGMPHLAFPVPESRGCRRQKLDGHIQLTTTSMTFNSARDHANSRLARTPLLPE